MIIGIIVLVIGIFWVLNNLKTLYKAGKFAKGGIGNMFSGFTGGRDDGKGENSSQGQSSERVANQKGKGSSRGLDKQIQSALAASTRAGKGRTSPVIVIVNQANRGSRRNGKLSQRRGSSRRASTRGSGKGRGKKRR